MKGLTPGLIAISVVGLLGLMAWAARRGRPRPGPDDHTVLFRHNGVFRWFAYVTAFGIPVGLTALVIAFPPKAEEVWYALGAYVLFAGLTLPLVWEASRFYLLATPEGLESRSPWRGLRFLAWEDVERVTFSQANAWFVFHGRDGTVIRVHMFVGGLTDLLRLTELRVPAGALKGARMGYERLGRPFPRQPDQPVLEARPPRRPW